MWSGSGLHGGAAARAGVTVFAAVFALTAAAQEARTGGPYVPTPQAVVDEMLKIANVTAKDHVIDLGSGDGRIVLTAARRYRATGLGVDIDEELVAQSNAAAERDNIQNLARFVKMDVLEANIREASVVALYLLPEMMRMLQSRMLFDLKPGTRVVSHDFDFGGWQPDRKVMVELAEKYNVTGSFESTVYLWVVPARVQGRWRVTVEGGRRGWELAIRQEYQAFDGVARHGARETKLAAGRIRGARMSFRVPGKGPGAGAYHATVNGETMRGEATIAGASVKWSAKRIDAIP